MRFFPSHTMSNVVLCFLIILSLVSGRFTSLSGLYSDVCQSKDKGGISHNNNIQAFNPDRVSSDINFPYVERELIVSSFNKDMAFWAVNFLESLSKLARPLEKSGITVDYPEVIFIIFDEATLELCDSMYLPCWYPRDMFSHPPLVLGKSRVMKQKKNRRGSGASLTSTSISPFRVRYAQRLQGIALLIGAGANVLLTETDVYWLRSPYPVISKKSAYLLVPPTTSPNGAGILYARGMEEVSDLFRKSFDNCLADSSHHRFTCVQQSISSYNKTRYVGPTSFPVDGCQWKDLTTEERASAYLFYGRCKSSKAVRGHGLLATLQYYDLQGMLNLKFLHDWLITLPPNSLDMDVVPQPKRIYVGDAKPPAEYLKTENILDLSMFSNPSKAFNAINNEILSIAKRSNSLVDFLERVSLHRNDLLG